MPSAINSVINSAIIETCSTVMSLSLPDSRSFVVRGISYEREDSLFRNMLDCDEHDVANLVEHEVGREMRARWRRIRICLKLYLLSSVRSRTSLVAAEGA